MIESVKDFKIEKSDNDEQIDIKVKEILGIGFSEMKNSLSEYVVKESSKIAEGFMNIAPLGDYDKFTEDQEKIIDFLKTEAHKPEHWKIYQISSNKEENIVHFQFMNDAIDQGDNFEGMVYVSYSGKIQHVFAQSCE